MHTHAALKRETYLRSLVPKKITAQLIIGTPGKILDLITRRKLDTRAVNIFVLDEADVMLAQQGMKAQSLRLKTYAPTQNDRLILISCQKY